MLWEKSIDFAEDWGQNLMKGIDWSMKEEIKGNKRKRRFGKRLKERGQRGN